MNKLGHSESNSFSLELDTAIAEAADLSSNLLSEQIVRNPDTLQSVFHSEFDNIDQFINNLTGMGSIHTAHGIMMQEVDNSQGICPEPPRLQRTKKRSLELPELELPEVYVTNRRSPSLQVTQYEFQEGSLASSASVKRQKVWLLSRMKFSAQKHLPSWSGFVSQTGSSPEHLTTIDYYPPIPKPITDYKTVAECLRFAEEATNEVGQEYVLTTCDLGVCMKAYPLVWNNPEKYAKHLILIGSFHVACSYLKMIGKKMRGSGLEEVLIEAGLISCSSLEGVMTGKNYERAIHCHKVMLESLERLLVEQFLIARDENELFCALSDESCDKLDKLAGKICPENLNAVLADTSINEYIQAYQQFCNEVRNENLGKTAAL